MPPPGNDPSGTAWRDDDNTNSNPVGFIYDLDVPRLREDIGPVNEIRRLRANFKAFATVQLVDGNLVRASLITTYHVAFSIKQLDSPEGVNWQTDSHFAGDNTATYRPLAPLPVTWNLDLE